MNGRAFTPSEDEILRELYPLHSAAELAVAMGRAKSSINKRAAQLGVRKSREWIAERAREQSLVNANCIRSRFVKGRRPWNKGAKGLSIPGTEATRFAPGNRPQTDKPIGSEVVRDGQLWRKVRASDPRGARFCWDIVSRMVWIAAHGPVPAGHVVTFKRGMHTVISAEITLDRLELITRAELGNRNRDSQYPPELRAAIRALSRLKKEVANEEQNGKRARPSDRHA